MGKDCEHPRLIDVVAPFRSKDVPFNRGFESHWQAHYYLYVSKYVLLGSGSHHWIILCSENPLLDEYYALYEEPLTPIHKPTGTVTPATAAFAFNSLGPTVNH